MSNYFRYSDVVDVHNQDQQLDLRLEKKCIMQYGYFRLYTTMVGMYAIDVWKICKSLDKNHSTICQYANMLAGYIMEYATNFTDDEDA